MNTDSKVLYSKEAEQAVLGGLILYNESWISVVEILSKSDFYYNSHQIIFESIQAILEKDEQCDVVIISEYLQRTGQLEKIGGGEYIGRIAVATPHALNINAYALIVHEHSILRQISKIGREMAEKALNPGDLTSLELLSLFEQKALGISKKRQEEHFVTFNTLLTSSIKKIDELSKNPLKMLGLETGFRDLDKLTNGLQESDLIIVAGRPSMGKTSFALNIAQHAIFNLHIPVAVFSMEMSAEQLMMRIYASSIGINLSDIRSGRLNDEQWDRLLGAMITWDQNSPPLFIDESSTSLDVNILRSQARRLKREQPGLGLIVIDYLQLMRGNGNTRNDEIGSVSQSLKALAKELELPVIVVSQLNRNVESRPDKRPKMSDLRDSGSIEQDADVILLLYRDEVYDVNTAEKGIAEIIIAKQRNGPIDTIKLLFEKQYTLFKNGEFYFDNIE